LIEIIWNGSIGSPCFEISKWIRIHHLEYNIPVKRFYRALCKGNIGNGPQCQAFRKRRAYISHEIASVPVAIVDDVTFLMAIRCGNAKVDLVGSAGNGNTVVHGVGGPEEQVEMIVVLQILIVRLAVCNGRTKGIVLNVFRIGAVGGIYGEGIAGRPDDNIVGIRCEGVSISFSDIAYIKVFVP
jgi:hypothetical protein